MADLPKHPGPRLSLQTRSNHVNRMANMVDSVVREKTARGIMRPAEAEEIARYNADVIGTFRWLIDNEADIRAWLRLTADQRAAIIAEQTAVAEATEQAVETAP